MSNFENLKEKDDENDPRREYSVKRTPIGRGAFSEVYYAVDKQKNVFAMKRIPIDKVKKSDDDNSGFLLELEISKRIKHPNIVRAYKVFKTEKYWYIVTDYCNNGTLKDIIDKFKNSNIPPYDREMVCKRYLTQLKNALKYLFKNNIVHRDLKPQNILISNTYPNDILKLADFGFSRYFNSEDKSGEDSQESLMVSFCGTPLYMAPELLIDKKYNSKADLWSFGVIMYEMLYGVNPYNYPKNMSNLLDLIKTKEITYPDIYSKQCIDLLKSILQTDSKKRIDWKIFFRHEWFDKKIPSGFSHDSLMGSVENLQTLDNEVPYKHNNTPSPSSKSSDTEQFPSVDNTQPIKSNTPNTVNNTSTLTNINDNDDDEICDFEVINFTDLAPCDYDSYKEEVSQGGGILQILSNSVKYLLKGSLTT